MFKVTPKTKLIDSMDNFESGYLSCALWTARKYPNSDTNDTNLDEYSASNFSVAALRSVLIDCRLFKDANSALLDLAYEFNGYDEAQAGHDFSLTRNGHGAGYWDRGLGEVGEKLTAASKLFGEVNTELYKGLVRHCG